MAGEPAPVRRVGRVQRGVINDQNALGALDLGSRFVPQPVRIAFQAMRQAGQRIVRGRRIALLGLHPRHLRAGEGARAGDQKIDVVLVAEFGLILAAFDSEKR